MYFGFFFSLVQLFVFSIINTFLFFWFSQRLSLIQSPASARCLKISSRYIQTLQGFQPVCICPSYLLSFCLLWPHFPRPSPHPLPGVATTPISLFFSFELTLQAAAVWFSHAPCLCNGLLIFVLLNPMDILLFPSLCLSSNSRGGQLASLKQFPHSCLTAASPVAFVLPEADPETRTSNIRREVQGSLIEGWGGKVANKECIQNFNLILPYF